MGCSSKYQYCRDYKLNDTYSYKITTYSKRGNNEQTKSTAIAHHTVIKNSRGIPSESIKWKKILIPDAGINYDSIVENFQPYEISLHPKGRVELPALTTPELTGVVTDLNTFFVCLSTHTGIDRLSEVGETYTDPETRIGDFSNDDSIMFGKDCIELTHKLVAIKSDTVIFESKFLPPQNSDCSEIAYNEHINLLPEENFNMIRKNGENSILYFKGTEDFTITSKVEKQSGKLLYAEMINNLNLKMKLNCTSDLDSCSQEFPFKIWRKVILEIQDN